MKTPFPQAFQLFFLVVLKWQKDNCLDMGATLSYHALFSLFPLLLLSLTAFSCPVRHLSWSIGKNFVVLCVPH